MDVFKVKDRPELLGQQVGAKGERDGYDGFDEMVIEVLENQ
jgi:hypothetical protein